MYGICGKFFFESYKIQKPRSNWKGELFFSPLFYFFTWLSAFVNLGLYQTFVYLGFHGSWLVFFNLLVTWILNRMTEMGVHTLTIKERFHWVRPMYYCEHWYFKAYQRIILQSQARTETLWKNTRLFHMKFRWKS